MSNKQSPLSIRALYTVIAVAGSALLIGLYLADRSVFLDEANLIRNIVERDFGSLVGPLGYEQSAPFLFTWLVKSCTAVGTNSFIFRFIPLTLALLSVWLMRSVLLRLQLRVGGLVALLYMTCHELVLQYGSECKQYSADLLATLLLLALALSLPPSRSAKSIAIWVVAGIGLQLLSMPSVLILASVGLYWLVSGLPTKEGWLPLVSIGVPWVLAFVANYFLVLRPGIGSAHMQAFHEPYFFDPSGSAALSQLLIVVKLLGKKTAVGIAAALLLLLAGATAVYRKRSPLLVLLLLPIALTYVLSAFGMYSLIERLLLFLLPLTLLLVAYGLDYLVYSEQQWASYLVAPLLAIGLLVAISHRQGFKWFSTHPYEDLRSTLDQMPAAPPTPMYLSKHAVATYHYYTQIETIYPPNPYLAGTVDTDIDNEVQKHIAAHGSTWVILSHVKDLESCTQQLRENHTVLQSITSEGSAALLLEN